MRLTRAFPDSIRIAHTPKTVTPATTDNPNQLRNPLLMANNERVTKGSG
jgi:hypothetical protein